MRITQLAACIVIIFAACSDDAAAGDVAPDTGADLAGEIADVSAPDATGDSGQPEVSADTTPDAPDTAPDAPDTTVDAAPDSTADAAPDSTADAAPDAADAAPDASLCEYFEDPEFITCGISHTQILHWKSVAPDACPPYYTRGAARYDSVAELASAEGCDASCVYVAFQAVDFIRCDGQGRSGWETFQAAGEGCLDALYRTADGVFTDLCLWAVYACYCEEG